MNVGGDPGQDDYGLPPVDIEIPDDARELDGDVQAYYRELRAQRRQRRLQRLASPFAADGMVLPLLAGCLALTLFAGTLLTVLSGGQQRFIIPMPTVSPRATARQSPTPGSTGRLLPDGVVLVDGRQVRLRSLAASVLALVPPGCGCQAALTSLATRASRAGARVYVVGVNGAQVAGLARRVGLNGRHAVEDTSDVLASYYRPAGLTVLFVHADGMVGDVLPAPAHDRDVLRALRQITSSPSPQAT